VNTNDGSDSPPLPTPRRRGRRLKSIENLRAFVADVLRRVETGVPPGAPLDPARARVLLYGASILVTAIGGADLEARVTAIEAAQSAVGERRLAP
jgi:hypothetical protein